jgi:hypothetical protein
MVTSEFDGQILFFRFLGDLPWLPALKVRASQTRLRPETVRVPRRRAIPRMSAAYADINLSNSQIRTSPR